ncbi:hypothetical protein DLJ49_16960 [Rhodovulum sp. 12E13]|uniref:glucosamine inositolphosphorylceramide transferase family protein n=1 Tax=Rhodovulum sp. 12E13 TaxID=2203891 RepID=UPI000E17DCC3|nr:hypothetical protein [Rhodovulum sp. 12E13]RDC70984.1 hypothetical protein DLJ49_16960 [Rhodovulum sp. 12E13]
MAGSPASLADESAADGLAASCATGAPCPDRTARAPLRVALILPEGRAAAGVDAAGAWLARWLDADPRMALVEIRRAPPAPAPGGALGAVARLEARAVRLPQAAPLPAPRLEIGAAEVAVDLTGGGAAAWEGDLPPHGVWRLTSHAPGAGLAEAMRGRPATEVALLRETAGGAQEIDRARYNTKFLAARNAAFAAEKSVQLAARRLAALHAGAGASAAPRAGPASPPAASLAAYAPRLALALGRRLATKGGRRLGLAPGDFALRLCPGGALDFDPARGMTLVPPKGHYWADPFLFEHRGQTFLFWEDYFHALGRGTLQAGRLEGDRLTPLGAPLEAEHHLSYPFVFAAGGDIWLMPETIGAGRLEVWRATDFPLGWERAATAFEGRPPADAVLAQVGGDWWLFANFCEDGFGDYGSELHLFRVDGPRLREIEPHPLNPVVIDAATARGGGRVWQEGGRLYRASQDNTHDLYGWGLNVMEITRLDMAGYAERRVRHVRPGFRPGVIGCHHLDFAGGRVVIDVRYRFPRLARG